MVRESLSQIRRGLFGNVNRKQKAMMRLMLDEMDRLYRIVNDLLDISRMEAGKTTFHKALFNLSELVRRHIQGSKYLLSKKKIGLKLLLPPDPVVVFADSVKIAQVLTNLISNAFKFTPTGGRILVQVQKSLSEVMVSVSDDGVGISPEDLPRLFSKFSQVGPAIQTDLKGAGLGLAISKGLVEFHRGRLWAESKVGRGSKFIFTLPVLSKEEISRECVDAGISEAAQRKSPMLLYVIKFENYEKSKDGAEKVNSQVFLKGLEGHLSRIFKENASVSFNETSECILMLPGANRENAVDYEKKFKFLIGGFIEQVKKKYSVDLKVKTGWSIYPEEGETSDKLLMKARISVRELLLSKEHRKKPRKNFQINVNFALTAGKTVGVQTIDISEGGLCLNSNHNLGIGSKHTVVFQLPDGRGRIETRAAVRWIEKIAGSGACKVGLHFSEMSSSSKKALKDFLNQRTFHDKS